MNLTLEAMMARTGRPRTFDRDAAIKQAMHLFWQHGYEMTPLSRLKAVIGGGISAPSFYAAFSSKGQLFREAVNNYLENYGQVTHSLFDDTLSPQKAIETTLRRSAEMQYEKGHPRGCMVALGVMSGSTAESQQVLEPLLQARARTREGFRRCISRGIAQGEIAESAEPEGLAMMFDAFLLGISTQVRDGVNLATIHAAITSIMTSLPAE